ncbi:hypothetical protein ACOSQ2_020632 [Xanthoceras sorbifolium]
MGAGNSARSVLVTLLIFAMVFSPMLLPSEAARNPAVHVTGKNLPPILYCPHCVCCEPAPPGQCCKCNC